MASENNPTPLAKYVGVGIGSYTHKNFSPLPHAIPEVREVAAVLRHHSYDTQVIEDPENLLAQSQLLAALPAKTLTDGALIIYWAGHGEFASEGRLNLVATNSTPLDTPIVTGEFLAGVATRTGATQIMLIFDTCYSGSAAISVLDTASRILRETPAKTDGIWIGVITSAMDYQRAKDGVFGAHLLRLLREGPTNPELRLRWSTHSAGVRGDDVIDAVLKEWTVADQQPKQAAFGNAAVMLPNPLYRAGAPERIVEHLLLAARGVEPGEEGYYFTGRIHELERISTWIKAGKPGIFVVTGPAGTGKSAIVGRIVSLANAEEREFILSHGQLEHTDPGPGSVHAHVQARGLTAETFCEILDDCLVEKGMLVRASTGPRNRGELLGAIERLTFRPVVAIDGLDEAGSHTWQIAEDVIRLLSKCCLLLVSTRELPPQERPLSLLQTLASENVLDLGDGELRDSAKVDLLHYVEKRLSDLPSSMNVQEVADFVVGVAFESEEETFLLARVITSQLRSAPVDTARPEWKETINRNIEEAFQRDIAAIGADGELPKAQNLLTALAWGYGVGMPDDVWAVIATAISSTTGCTAATCEREDIFWLLGKASRYIVEGGEDGRAVYRLAHQRFVECLRTAGPLNSQALEVARSLTNYYSEIVEGGHRKSPYLEKYLWRHCSDAGIDGITLLRGVMALNPALPELGLAMALNEAAGYYSILGSSGTAVGLAEESVTLYRKLAENNPALQPELAAVLSNLGDFYEKCGKNREAIKQTKRSAKLFEEVVSNNAAYAPDLAKVYFSLGTRYSLERDDTKAVHAAERASKLYGKLVIKVPAYMADLAKTQTSLISLYGLVGKRPEALKSTEKAARLYEKLTRLNSSFTPDFIRAASNFRERLETVKPSRAQESLKRLERAGLSPLDTKFVKRVTSPPRVQLNQEKQPTATEMVTKPLSLGDVVIRRPDVTEKTTALKPVFSETHFKIRLDSEHRILGTLTRIDNVGKGKKKV